MENKQMVTDKELPLIQKGLYGIQHVFVSNVWLDPLFIAVMIGLPAALSANLVSAIFLAAGMVTLLQASRWVKLPVVQGPSASFDALLITAGKAGQLGAAGGALLAGSLAVFLLGATGVLGRIRRFFTPLVSGVVTTVVGIALAGFTLMLFLGGNPGDPAFLSNEVLIVSGITATSVLILSFLGKGIWRTIAFVISLLIGYVLAFLFDMVSFTDVKSSEWIGLPQLLPFGSLQWDWKWTGLFFVAYFSAMVEAMGVYAAAADATGETLSDQKISRGFMGEAAGSFASIWFGGFPTTAYGQNAGLIRMTGVASRHAVMIAGFLFLMLGLVPKAGAIIASTPSAVVGGLFLPASVSLIVSGLRLFKQMDPTEGNYFAAGFSLLSAIVLPDFFQEGKSLLLSLLSSSIFVGAMTVVLCQIILFIGSSIRKNEEEEYHGPFDQSV